MVRHVVRRYLDTAFADYSKGFWNAVGMGVAGGIVAIIFKHIIPALFGGTP